MRLLLIAILISTMFLASCGSNTGEKIAVVDWDKIVESHVKQGTLKYHQAELSKLLQQREEYMKIGREQIMNLAKIQELKQTSKQEFAMAEYSTLMAEREILEREAMQDKIDAAEKEADAAISDTERELEEHYRLRMVNIRLRLDSLKLSNEEKNKLINELASVQDERDNLKAQIQAKKDIVVNNLLAPEMQEVRARMDAYSQEITIQIKTKLENDLRSDAAQMREVPESLSNLIASIDKSIDDQNQAIDAVNKGIKADVESIVMKLARENNYTIVFHKVRTNIKAEDITQKIINDLQTKKQ